MKRRTVAFAPEARRDLLDLGDCIAERAGIDIASSYIERLEAYCLSFEMAGERGQRRDDIRAGLRIIGFEKRIAIAFTVSETEVTILRLTMVGRIGPELRLHLAGDVLRRARCCNALS